MSIDVGIPAPAFTLETADGPVSLSDYAGQKLVLYFYPKDDTSGCTTEAIQFSGLLAQFKAAGTSVLGVSKDTVAKHRKFADKHALTVALGSDPDGAVIEAYGSWIEKTLYGRKYMGIDRSTFLIGPDGRIAAIWRKVKVAGHAEAVLKAAEAL